jgi:hypothetical protein
LCGLFFDKVRHASVLNIQSMGRFFFGEIGALGILKNADMQRLLSGYITSVTLEFY